LDFRRKLERLRELESSNQPNSAEIIELIKLSKNKGIKIIQAILINRFPNAIENYNGKEIQNLIIDLISEISEHIYCAGWYSDIEFELWKWIDDESTIPEAIIHRVERKDLSELKMLSDKLQLWAYWDNEDEARSIGIRDWIELVKRKKADNPR